jgi:hypothetical protein
MEKLRIPEHLELLLTDEPVLDLYSFGPWRVPHGLYEEIAERAKTLNSHPKARDFPYKLTDFFDEHGSPPGAETWLLLSYLLGIGSVRGGSAGDIQYETLNWLLAKNLPPDRIPVLWFTQATEYRPPGEWLLDNRYPSLELRELFIEFFRACLDVFAGLEPLEERRQALIKLHEFAAADPTLRELSLRARRDDLCWQWADKASDDILAALPELAGSASYLEWACAGLYAAHERLREIVPAEDQHSALARLLLQADIVEAPIELAIGMGFDVYETVQEKLKQFSDKHSSAAWQAEIRTWLLRCLLAGEIDFCRSWLDMAVRVTASAQGLPGPAKLKKKQPPIPVEQFQIDVRQVFRRRSAPNPLVAATARRDNRRPQPASPTQAAAPPESAVRDVD